MRTSLRSAALVNASWMAFVWGTRLRNAWVDDGLSGAGLVGPVAMASGGLVGAVVLVVVGIRREGAVAARVVALLHVVVWVWRALAILLADHDVAFVVVHELLAIVSVALGVWLWRAAGSTGGDRFRRAGAAPLPSPSLWDSPSR